MKYPIYIWVYLTIIYAFFNGTLSQKIELQCAYNNYITKLINKDTISLILYLQFENLGVRKVCIIIV
jgi:hypothetical protein